VIEPSDAKKVCKICKNIFYVIKKTRGKYYFCSSKSKRFAKTNYCSIKCAKKLSDGWKKNIIMLNGKDRVRSGEKHPFYGKHHTLETREKMSLAKTKEEKFTGFKNSQNYLQRRVFKKQIQKQVFERDNYTCQLCMERGGDLQVDHIQSWSEYVELRFSLDNCRTLCAACHYQITFGRPMPSNVKGWGHNLLERGRLV